MWKDILKLDPKEAREFNELGDKYAPDDMEEASLNRNIVSSGKQITKDTETLRDVKDKIQSMKNKIDSDDYMIMQTYLEQMEKNIGQPDFRQYLQALKHMSREYPIFFRGR